MDNDNNNPQNSLLDSIINAKNDNQDSNIQTNQVWNDIFWDTQSANQTQAQTVPSTQQNQNNKPPKKSKSTWDFLRIFWSIALAWVILFSFFIAYIVFNPDQAQFFISLWINPRDIKILLKNLVNVSFWAMTWFFSLVTLIFLYKAFVTKKEYAKKKTISIIMSIFCIIILFSEIWLWFVLWEKISAEDYENPYGWVIIYDNEKSKSEKFANWLDEINDFSNLIWPVSMRFDLSVDARYVQKNKLDITSYEIDFNWDWKIDKTWTDPEKDIWIIYDYKKKWSYTPTWKYIWKDRVSWKIKDFPMKLPKINVLWIINLTQKNDRLWWKRAFFDLSDIKSIWRLDFYIEDSAWNFDKPDSTYDWWDKFSPTQTFKSETLVCIVIKNNQKSKDNCDKIMIVWEEGQLDFTWEIIEERDPTNPLNYNFTFKSSDPNAIIDSYEWLVDKNTIVSNDEMFEYTFLWYWKHEVKLTVKLTNWTVVPIIKDLRITKPITLARPTDSSPYWTSNSILRITDGNWKSLIEWTWERDIKAYHLKVWIPNKLTFDASFVTTVESSYDLTKVEWDFDWDWKADKVWEKINYEFLEEKNYPLVVTYYFESKIKKDSQIIWEKINIEAWKKDIEMNLKIDQESDYAPTTVHFDWSATAAKEWKIVKFTYDFWEWREPLNWDAKQDYRYKYPWEYKVTFTATKEDWTKDTIVKNVILKEQSKDITINSSISTWYVWKDIDFDAAWTKWQVESYLWDFGDWNTDSDPTPTHSYWKAGEYKIKLTVTYADWIIKTWDKYITIK